MNIAQMEVLKGVFHFAERPNVIEKALRTSVPWEQTSIK